MLSAKATLSWLYPFCFLIFRNPFICMRNTSFQADREINLNLSVTCCRARDVTVCYESKKDKNEKIKKEKTKKENSY